MEKAEQLSDHHQSEQLDHQLRLRTDTETWLAEALNGSMRTSFEYHFDGQELYGEDGGAIGEIFDAAIETAHEIADRNPSLLFELRRRLIERGEYDDMLKMSRGELSNTMVVISDFPAELMDSSDDVGGYNVSRKQTMLRVISRQANGTIRMTTQSLDGSNRQALEAIYEQLGETVEPGELLEQRIHCSLPPQWQDKLVDNLTDTYDNSLAQRYGNNWHAGFKQPAKRSWTDTYQFAQNQQDVVEWFTAAKLADPAGAESLRYKLAATIHERYERHVRHQEHEDDIYPETYNHPGPNDFYYELEQASQRAQASGRTFSGCGASIMAGTAEQLGEVGYGNKSDEDKYGSLTFRCKKGHSNIRTPGRLMGECPACNDGGASVRC